MSSVLRGLKLSRTYRVIARLNASAAHEQKYKNERWDFLHIVVVFRLGILKWCILLGQLVFLLSYFLEEGVGECPKLFRSTPIPTLVFTSSESFSLNHLGTLREMMTPCAEEKWILICFQRRSEEASWFVPLAPTHKTITLIKAILS